MNNRVVRTENIFKKMPPSIWVEKVLICYIKKLYKAWRVKFEEYTFFENVQLFSCNDH